MGRLLARPSSQASVHSKSHRSPRRMRHGPRSRVPPRWNGASWLADARSSRPTGGTFCTARRSVQQGGQSVSDRPETRSGAPNGRGATCGSRGLGEARGVHAGDLARHSHSGGQSNEPDHPMMTPNTKHHVFTNLEWLTPFRSRGDAERAVRALRALRATRFPDEADALAATPCGSRKQAEYAPELTLDGFFERAARLEGSRESLGREHVLVICQELGRRRPPPATKRLTIQVPRLEDRPKPPSRRAVVPTGVGTRPGTDRSSARPAWQPCAPGARPRELDTRSAQAGRELPARSARRARSARTNARERERTSPTATARVPQLDARRVHRGGARDAFRPGWDGRSLSSAPGEPMSRRCAKKHPY